MPSFKPMRLTLKQKRFLLRVTEPILRPLYFLYRLLTLELFADHRLPGSAERSLREPEKILVVRLDNIGDVLLSEPAICALRERFPHARLDVVVAPEGKAILQGNPCIDSFIVYKVPWHAAWRGERVSWWAALKEMWRVLRQLRREHYDIAFELRGDFRDILFTVATGARIRVGSGWRGGGFLLDYDVAVDKDAHRVELALGIVAVAGATTTRRTPVLYLGEKEQARACQLLPLDASSYIAFHLGSGFSSKCLPIEKFAQVAHALCKEGRQAVLVGGLGERALAEEFLRLVPCPSIDLVGKLGLLELAAVLERCSLFIGNDSGPMHLAAAVGTPVVAFFGPSELRTYHPCGAEYRIVEVDLTCRPCDHVHCIHKQYLCMTSIAAEDIIAAARELLSKGRKEVKEPSPSALPIAGSASQ